MNPFAQPLLWIPLLPILGALVNLTIGRHASRRFVHAVAIGSVVAACGLSFYMVLGPLYKAWKAGAAALPKQAIYTWIEVGSFKAELAFRLDTLSAVMIMIVTFVGSLIHIYSTGYMSDEKRYAAYFGYLNLFTGAMLILVLAANLPVMFIGWEGVGLCSFLLIGFWFEKTEYANAGRKAFVVNRIGDFAFLLGMFLLYWATKDSGFAQSLDFADLNSPSAATAYTQSFWGNERLAAVAGILLFIGACGKSAQVPLYVWLPDAMAGPTPVSALIHAATMVTAGVYMICKLSLLYASSTTAMAVVAGVGTITALAAAFMAFAQTDLKKVLAYSTVSQLGFMFVAAGTGNWVAAIFHLGTHAFFKAGLFLGAGSVMHGMNGSGDILKMGGLRKHMPITRLTFAIYCLAIAGFPLLSGFFSKDEILAGAWGTHPPGWPMFYGKLLWVGLTVAALGTAFYMWRLYFLVFSGEERSDDARHAHESPLSMTGPLLVLALLAVVAGVVGLPHLSGVHLPHLLPAWLEPTLTHVYTMGPGEAPLPITPHLADGTTLALMGTATVVGLLGMGLAYYFYGRGPSPKVDRLVEGPLAGAYEASRNKLWVDEIYESTLVRPFRALARGTFEIADRFIIDTVVVGGAALVVSSLSRIAQWLQNGQVQRYLAGIVLGGAVIFFVTTSRQHPTFSYRWIGGGELELRAEPGEGLAGVGTKLRWDLDGDGRPDTRPGTELFVDDPVLRVRAGEVGAKVTLWIDSGIDRGRVAITRTITLDAPPAAAAAAGEVR
ncbi:MAG: NADH-quinone oxidoreductase subunit L [Kofleriaceae bacterium]